MVSVRAHEFIPEASVTTWNGRPGCAVCPLPQQHEIHKVEPPEDDVSDRLLGEHEETE